MVNPLKKINDFLRYLIALFDVGGRGLKITPEDNPPNNLQVVDCSVSPAMVVPWKRELKKLSIAKFIQEWKKPFFAATATETVFLPLIIIVIDVINEWTASC